MADEDKPIKIKHEEIHVNGKTFGWVEIEIHTGVLVGFILFVFALLYYLFS